MKVWKLLYGISFVFLLLGVVIDYIFGGWSLFMFLLAMSVFLAAHDGRREDIHKREIAAVLQGSPADEIVCRKLTVVDEKGDTEISLGAGTMSVRDTGSKARINLNSHGFGYGPSIIINDEQGNVAIRLASNELKNYVQVRDKKGKHTVALSSTTERAFLLNDIPDASYVEIRDNQGQSVRLQNKDGNYSKVGSFDRIVCREFEVVDEDGKKAILLASDELGNRVVVLDKQGEKSKPRWGNVAVNLSSREDENFVAVIDKTGKVTRLGD